MSHFTITIDMDKKCAECGKPGPADSGICLACTTKAMKGRTMKSPQGRAVQQRINGQLGKRLTPMTLAGDALLRKERP